MDGTKARTSVVSLAKHNPQGAAQIARKIEDPWFRCQSLAIAASHEKDPGRKQGLLDEALMVARLQGDPNRIVSVAAWPIKVLCNGGDGAAKLAKEIARLLADAQRVQSPVRKADALNLLLGALVAGPRDLFWKVYEGFLSACTDPLDSGRRNSKGESLLGQWAPVIMYFDPARGRMLIDAIQGPVIRKRAIEQLEKHSGESADALITWPNLD